VQLQQHFDQPHHAGARFEVTDVGLIDRSHSAARHATRASWSAEVAVRERQPRTSNRSPSDVAGPMCLDVADRPRIDARGDDRLSNGVGLSCGLGAVKPTVPLPVLRPVPLTMP
jgi:hypothetical protein